jgi:2-oxoisovalerate dehydrogenase E1 component
MLLPDEPGIYNKTHSDLLIVSYANGLRFSLRAARGLEAFGISARVLDLRWLNPLPIEAIRRHAEECGGGIADAVTTSLAETGFAGPPRSVRSADSYVPLGAAANLVLLSEDQIVDAAKEVAGSWQKK